MMNLTLQALGFITAAVIFWRAESILNVMASNCLLPVRLAFWMMCGGAFGMSVIILQGYVPPPVVILLTAGVACLLVMERRIGTILRLKTGVVIDRRAR